MIYEDLNNVAKYQKKKKLHIEYNIDIFYVYLYLTYNTHI